MNKIKRFGLFLLTVLIGIISVIITYRILELLDNIFRFTNSIYAVIVIGICFLVTIIKLYRYLFHKKFDVNLNADIIIILTAPLIFWLLIPVWLFVFHFYALVLYLVIDILIWCIKKYIEKREIKEYIKNIKKRQLM